jgi:hypothetical protein
MIVDVVLLLCTSPIPWQPDSPVLASPVSGQHETTVICSLALQGDFKVPQLGNVVVSWVLLLVYVDLRQHTLHGIFVGLCGASGNTFYWV